mmetsp:Transcript_40687/g.97586  ORF Transcript_40687/g.97586 Transcript_40687/m.97586 type:complete len:212 (-) Transcript_40687:33-668(-)
MTRSWCSTNAPTISNATKSSEQCRKSAAANMVLLTHRNPQLPQRLLQLRVLLHELSHFARRSLPRFLLRYKVRTQHHLITQRRQEIPQGLALGLQRLNHLLLVRTLLQLGPEGLLELGQGALHSLVLHPAVVLLHRPEVERRRAPCRIGLQAAFAGSLGDPPDLLLVLGLDLTVLLLFGSDHLFDPFHLLPGLRQLRLQFRRGPIPHGRGA